LKENQSFTVKTNTTLLPFLIECFPKKSRNHAKGLLSRGQIYVDGIKRTHFAYVLKPGQEITVEALSLDKAFMQGISIVFEDSDIIVIDKPCGMLSVATEKEREQTAYHIITDYADKFHHLKQIFIVHRLDRETSGIMMFAKNENIKNLLQERWDELVTHRGYTAVVEGIPQKSEGKIISWLKQTKTLIVYSSKEEGDGQKSITNYKTVKHNDSHSLIEISLETGRKNQIRAHMRELGHPVSGDKKYGAKTNPAERLCLHASRLSFIHPVSGKVMDFCSPVPRSFLKLLS